MDPAQGKTNQGNTNDKNYPPKPFDSTQGKPASDGDWRPPPPDWSQQMPVSQEPGPAKIVTPSQPAGNPLADTKSSSLAPSVLSHSSSGAPVNPLSQIDTQARGPFSTVPVPDELVKPAPIMSAIAESSPPLEKSTTSEGLKAAPSMEMRVAQAANLPLTAPSMEVPTVPPMPVMPEEKVLTPGGGKKGGGKLFLFLLLILVIVVTLGSAGYFYFYMQQPTPTTEFEPSPEAVSSIKPVALGQAQGKLLYIKDKNVFSYDLATNKETQLTQDGSEAVAYQLPKWVSGDTISLVLCDNKSADGKSPYTCRLHTRELVSSTPVEIASVSSQPNTSGVQLGGFTTYAWDSKKKQLAYLVDEFVDKNTSTKLYYKADASASAILLKEFVMTGGRGGSPDDTVRLEFSPDGEKLLMNFTWLYPPASADKDEGTLFVFDLPSKQLVWNMKETVTSHANFLSGHILAAKQASTATDSATKPPQVVWIDLIKSSTDPKEGITKITDAPNWYGFEPLTKELLVFYSVASETGKGVALEELDLTSKSKKPLKEQLLPVKVLDEKTVLVATMKKCNEIKLEESCGIDLYNGYLTDGIGVFDTDAKSVRNLTIASSSAILPGIDYLE